METALRQVCRETGEGGIREETSISGLSILVSLSKQITHLGKNDEFICGHIEFRCLRVIKKYLFRRLVIHLWSS